MKAFVLTVMAALIGIIELILFSWFAYLFGVTVDPSKMSLTWTLGFYALYLIPGLLLFLAFINIVSTFED